MLLNKLKKARHMCAHRIKPVPICGLLCTCVKHSWASLGILQSSNLALNNCWVFSEGYWLENLDSIDYHSKSNFAGYCMTNLSMKNTMQTFCFCFSSVNMYKDIQSLLCKLGLPWCYSFLLCMNSMYFVSNWWRCCVLWRVCSKEGVFIGKRGDFFVQKWSN